MSTPGQPLPSAGEPPSGPPEQTEPDPGRVPRRSRGRTVSAALLAVLGLGALVGGGTGLALELTRKPTAKEVKAAAEKERALRWRYLTAGEIFPASVQYGSGLDGKVVQGEESPRTARRVGIVPETSCADAFDRPLAEVLTEHGCLTALRATYLDDSATQVMTVGVAVMPSSERVQRATDRFGEKAGFQGWREMGVRAHAFPGTSAARFGDDARQTFSMEFGRSPYIYLRTAGWADGRRRAADKQIADRFVFSSVVLNAVRDRFAELPDPCDARGVEC